MASNQQQRTTALVKKLTINLNIIHDQQPPGSRDFYNDIAM